MLVVFFLATEWWIMLDYKIGQTNPLTRIAIRVLSQTTSSSQCERNWSTFSLIHTKVRNRLSPTRLEKLVYCHYNMRLRIKCITERQKKTEQRLMSFAGRNWEQRLAETEMQVTSDIDVDELLDEQHPLNAWVDTRRARDVPEFDPSDVSWAEGELDGVEAEDPEFRVHDTELEIARSTIAKEKEQLTYMKQRKRRVLTQRSTHSSDDDDDDDDGDGAATGGATIGGGARHSHGGTGYIAGSSYRGASHDDETEYQGSGGGGGGGGQKGYEGQQHHAGYEWPPWEPTPYSSGSTQMPIFQPPILPYSDISSSHVGVQEGAWRPWPSQSQSQEQGDSEATSTLRPIGIWCPPLGSSQSGGESSSQQYTPRGIQKGMHDLASSLFGYDYNVNEESSSSGWQNY